MITKNESGRLYIEYPDNREYLSSLSVLVEGEIPNMLILSGKQHLEKWFAGSDLEDNVAFAETDKIVRTEGDT